VWKTTSAQAWKPSPTSNQVQIPIKLQIVQDSDPKIKRTFGWTILWALMLELAQSAVVKINKEEKTHQVVFKRIRNYATDVHYRHIQITVNLSQIIDTPMKAMATIDSFIKNMYHQSIIYYKDHQRGSIADKHQTHLAAQLI
jgi:hypothetical protein